MELIKKKDIGKSNLKRIFYLKFKQYAILNNANIK